MSVRILTGDCREVLKTLPDESIHCCVTSPPYLGLRDYQTAKWDGGDPACDHRKVSDADFAVASSTLGGGKKTTGHLQEGYGSECGKCGARRVDAQIGLEPTPDAYVAELVAVFREVRRVLRRDGTVWLNLGDSYAGSWGNQGRKEDRGTQRPINGPMLQNLEPYPDKQTRTGTIPVGSGLKPKDLIGIPWRVAFALQADGWWLRQDIIWSKPNPMPESVTDRCTKSHEYIFLLTKAERYYYDAAAIAEKADIGERPQQRRAKEIAESAGLTRAHIDAIRAAGVTDTGKARVTQTGTDKNTQEVIRLAREAKEALGGYYREFLTGEDSTRNKRSVWTVTTQPFSEAHFATFPPSLIEPCILAGCPAKACAKCGAPWVREVEAEAPDGRKAVMKGSRAAVGEDGRPLIGDNMIDAGTRGSFNASRGVLKKTTLGFSPSCSCEAGTVPGTVLDPFGGAGTTGLVADRLQRNAILIELNPDYASMARRRIEGDAPLFAEAAE